MFFVILASLLFLLFVFSLWSREGDLNFKSIRPESKHGEEVGSEGDNIENISGD